MGGHKSSKVSMMNKTNKKYCLQKCGTTAVESEVKVKCEGQYCNHDLYLSSTHPLVPRFSHIRCVCAD